MHHATHVPCKSCTSGGSKKSGKFTLGGDGGEGDDSIGLTHMGKSLADLEDMNEAPNDDDVDQVCVWGSLVHTYKAEAPNDGDVDQVWSSGRGIIGLEMAGNNARCGNVLLPHHGHVPHTFMTGSGF